MPILPNHAAVTHFPFPFSEAEIQRWSAQQRRELGGPATFALIFCSQEHVDDISDLIEIVQIYAHVPTVVGCSGVGLIANSDEIENDAGVSIALYRLPGTQAIAHHIPTSCFGTVDTPASFKRDLGSSLDQANAWMLFASSESIGHDSWLPAWNQATGGKVTIGGFASSPSENPQSHLFLNGQHYQDGAVALSLEGHVTIEPLLTQGCRPIGSPWIVTEAEHNLIHKIGNRPILEVLRDTLENMSDDDQQLAHGNIFIGLVLDEYKSSFGTGDFLVRNLAAIDPQTGAIAIATPPRIGQNLQFQIRDPHTAAIDMEELLKRKKARLQGRRIYGGCLCDCIGRGASLYGAPNQDVSAIQNALPGIPLSGIFCNGEFATVKQQTQLHGYAASLGLFVEKNESANP
ncbi:FIST signal transduction protein [Coraliomargarita akajimensis]|uniref:FIST C domain protein n=1 Tax=Coraliomargarita akajimensis (strain DSM 45221 / IAM 15411 / JCM 23193 / KCTC 12865 / 04OKA010-24) TaxID=583355 RepID=D5EKP3_CORAD|nr:FIST N-terminal domain-containing protein [Coraliomargarita akajimensis]ADE54950.1 domain of unknown function DUF1745 [Coraliomargarita akajimensis DSM 45221]